MYKLPFPAALVFALLGGAAMNFAFPAFSAWWVAILALAFLLLGLRHITGWRALALGFVWGLTYFGPLLVWSLESVNGTVVPWLALTMLQATFIAGFAWLYSFLVSRPMSRGYEPLVAAITWVSVEQFRGAFPFGGFPWGNIAFSQVSGPLLHLAPWGGAILVSGTVALVAGTITSLFYDWGKLEPLSFTAVSMLLVVGSVFIPLPSTAAEKGELRVGLVQGNPTQRLANTVENARIVTASYRRLTEEYAATKPKIDLLLWPESASDLDPRTDTRVFRDIEAAKRAIGVPIVFGTQSYPRENLRYNEYAVWLNHGISHLYAKQHPVPFGEYMPFRSFFRFFSSAVDRVYTDMGAGTEPGVIAVPVAALGRDVQMGVGICFEVAYEGLIRESVKLGAELIVIPTNNSSFGFTQEAFQQRDMTRFRAVEHGRTAIQISTVGVSGVFLPNGATAAASSNTLFTQWVGEATVPLRDSRTLATMMGAWPRILVWILTIGWFVWSTTGWILERRTRKVEEEAA